MPALSKWKIWCDNENGWVYAWADAGSAPTGCPNNGSHTIDISRSSVVQTVEENVTQQEFREHRQGMVIDGVDFQVGQNEWKKVDYSLPKDLHIQEAWVAWKDCLLGDYGALMVIQPVSEASLAVAAAQDDLVVNVGAVAPYYDPSNGAKFIEFWSSDESELLEVHEIESVDGAEVTMATGLAAARDTTVKIKAVYGYYTSIRGTNNVEGGLRLLGTNIVHIENPYSISACLPAGMKISIRMKTADIAGTRELAVNFLFREPVA